MSDFLDNLFKDKELNRNLPFPEQNDVPQYSYNAKEVLDHATLHPDLSYQGTELTLGDDQFKAAKGILEWLYENPKYRAPFKRLSGSAGTGKSALISYLLQAREEIFPKYMRNRPVAVCTYTWKAALVLKSRNVDACSIHSIFYKPNGDNETGVTFERVPAVDIRETYSMIIVDEASMVDSSIRYDIESIGLPVLYVGDSAQ